MNKLFIASIVTVFAIPAHALMITDFGTGQFADGGSSGFTQTSATASFSGLDNGTSFFLGSFAPVNLTGLSSSLVLTGTQSTSNNSLFVLQLYDGVNFQDYNGNWGSFITGNSTSVALSIGSITSGFNFSQVQGLNILFGGTGNAITMTFDSLTTVIPEPTTYATLFGAASLGLVVWRKRRKSV